MAGILSKILNPIFGADTSEQDKAAEAALQRGQEAYSNITPPDSYVADPYQYVDLGGYNPNQVTAQGVAAPGQVSYDLADPRLAGFSQVSDNALNGVATDPRLKDAQYGSLGALDDIIKGGGLTAADQANLAKIESQVAQEDRGRRGAILQNMGARGMSGGGNELLAQLSSSQAATDRASQSGLDIAGLAQQRALSAIMQQGNLAGNMQSQDFSQQAQIANAQNAITQFNTANSNANSLANANMANQFATNSAQGNLSANNANVNNAMSANQYNAGVSNQAAQYNANAANAAAANKASNSQNVANLNTAGTNQVASARAALPQQNFQNQVTLANGLAGNSQQGVNYYTKQGDRAAQENANYLSALIKGASVAATPSKQ